MMFGSSAVSSPQGKNTNSCAPDCSTNVDAERLPVDARIMDPLPDPHLHKEISLVYICETPTIPRKFFIDKALELGVPKGPLRAKLVKGEAITLEDGRIIQPEQVTSPPRPGQVCTCC
jgi:ribonuclease Z